MTRMLRSRALLLGIVSAGLAALVVDAQSPAPPVFEVASIKVNRSGQDWSRFGNSRGGRVTVVNSSLREMLRLVYQVQDFQIEDAPGWAATERYDILAKAEGELAPLPAPIPGQDPPPLFLMMRSLLADRFKLAVHVETKTAPIYELVLARADRRFGHQLSVSNVDCGAYRAARRAAGAAPSGPGAPPPPPGPGERLTCGMGGGQGHVTGSAMPMSLLALSLSRLVSRPVLDRTDLAGNYDFALEFRPEQGPINTGSPDTSATATDGPSIFAALQEQLGLKLESARAPVEFLVVEHVEHPTED